MAVPLRNTAQTSTRQLTMLFMSLRATLHSLLVLSMRSSTISIRPLAKVSRFKKPGYCKRYAISWAACFSGLMVMDRPNTSFMV